MFPFWESVTAPIIHASGGRRIVEIGALRGENTVLMLEELGPDTELHVIDPLPAFDPAEHEAMFPGRYIFHRGLSLDELPNCPPFDVALIDGDHNWYTVYNELKQLAGVAEAAGAPMPIMIMHDVGWPYGRRDLYYGPEGIPAEHRQPYRKAGMRQGVKKLVNGGGLNPTLYNAIDEGGPRNGVMTGLDDFVAECPRQLRVVIIPIYFGLAIVVDQAILDANPELTAVLDHLESPEGRFELLQLSERVRLDAAIFEQNAILRWQGRVKHASDHFLDLLKGSLLNEHYLTSEARIAYLLRCLQTGTKVNPKVGSDPQRYLRQQLRQSSTARTSGKAGALTLPIAYAEVGRSRLDHLHRSLDHIYEENIPGDLADVGVGRGGCSIFLRGYVEINKLQPQRITDRTVWVVDEFRASEPDLDPSVDDDTYAAKRAQTDLNQVREAFATFNMLDEQVRFLQGKVDHSLSDAPIEQLALLRIGQGLGAEAGAVLDRLYDKVAPGGVIVVEEYVDPAVAEAVDAFRARRGLPQVLEQVDWSAVTWQRAETDATADAPPAPAVKQRIPLVPPSKKVIDLSVIVVFYNMKREAARTLRSLSRSYQQGIDDLDYEVIVVENGSSDEQKLGAEYVAGFGPEFRYIDMGSEATSSPTLALNKGLAQSRGRNICVMIDGAHVVTPGVIRHAMSALSLYEPAVVAAQQLYVGPGQQGDSMDEGYDQAAEDELFERIAWPTDGYRLFDISHFINDRDWFDGMWESNCLFAPRSLYEQVGGFDDSFDVPGGGYTNLDLWERLTSAPGVQIATMIGEGSFHQVHGGTTTNQADAAGRVGTVSDFREHYSELRGRPYFSNNTNYLYVGGFQVQSARRTKARRMSTQMFAPTPVQQGPEGIPDQPVPIPDELRTAFTEAYWHSLAFRQTTWLDKKLRKAPTDLIAYQELIVKVRPDVIIETGPGNGGRALFLASICDLIGHGQVVAVGREVPDDVEHPRITFIEGPPTDLHTVDEVKAIVGDGSALVILGSRIGKVGTVLEFDAYSPLVPKGSYVVIEETIVNGRPVWPGFGEGPGEAVKAILPAHPEFAADRKMERFGFSLNVGGYLKRVQ